MNNNNMSNKKLSVRSNPLFRKLIKLLLPLTLILFFLPFVYSTPLYSPTWGFKVDLPIGYEFTGGDGKDKFSFENKEGAKFDIAIYYASPGQTPPYTSLEAMAQDVKRRLNSSGDIDFFEYRQKKIYILELVFSLPGAGGGPMSGWALCTELGANLPRTLPGTAQTGTTGRNNPQTGPSRNTAPPPMLLAMAYGPRARQDLMTLHFSALDSLAPEESDNLAPGPITEFSYPRENRVKEGVFGLGLEAWIFKEDAEAAQALIDREFKVLTRYQNSPDWRDAWIRFYRAIYRDSFDRIIDIAFQVERKMNIPARENRELADQILQWVQSFSYERDLLGSDFMNLVTAATEGRGDCDSRAMLWAIVLKQANINSAIMVSRIYSHAMGLADVPGAGARFEVNGQKFLVAETTSKVSIGLIGETVSEVSGWLGIAFE